MDIYEAMRSRHSVRSYTEKRIDGESLAALQAEIADCNITGGLNIQLVTDDPNVFDNFLARYGKFSGVKNYVALIGKADKDLDEKIGYYGQRIAIKAQSVGLNTCWVALTFSKGKTKSAVRISTGEKLVCVLALGYGANQGVPHKNKPLEKLYKAEGDIPDWFRSGLEVALLAPTASNQQSFLLTHSGNTVKAESTGGFYAKVDLGIVKYHFEIGAGVDNFIWE